MLLTQPTSKPNEELTLLPTQPPVTTFLPTQSPVIQSKPTSKPSSTSDLTTEPISSLTEMPLTQPTSKPNEGWTHLPTQLPVRRF